MATGLGATSDTPAHAGSYATVRRGDVSTVAGAAGTVQSADTRELAFGTSGTVSRIAVKPGDHVRAGAVLARLDEAEAKDQVAVAKAALAASQDTYDKARQGICAGGGGNGGTSGGATPARPASFPESGVSTGSAGSADTASARSAHRSGGSAGSGPSPTPTPTPIPLRPLPTPTSPSPTPTRTGRPTGRPAPSGHPGSGRRHGGRGGGGGGGCKPGDVEQASANVTQDEVKVRQAERTLDATTLTAPISGTVLTVAGVTGGQVGSGGRTGFITLGDLTDLQVRAMFPLGEVNQLKIGQPATIALGMQPGRTYTGSVTRIDPAATTSGTLALYGVMISLDAGPPGLLTGMSATTEVTTDQAEDTLYVPVGAVRPKTTGGTADTADVLVRKGGRTTVRTVHLGVRGDRYIAVTSGLSSGDRVVIPTGTGTDGFPDPRFPGA